MKALVLLALLLPAGARAAEHPMAALVRDYYQSQYHGAITWSRENDASMLGVLASTEALVPGAREALLAMTKDRYIGAAIAYKMKPDPAVADSLIAVLDGKPDLREEELAVSLALVGDKRAVPHLWKAIPRFAGRQWDQAQFARTIHILNGDPKAIRLLAALARNKNEDLEKADIPLSLYARRILEERSPEDIPGIHPVVAALTRISFDYARDGKAADAQAKSLDALAASPAARLPGAREALKDRFEHDVYAGALLWKLDKDPSIAAAIVERAKDWLGATGLFALGYIGDPRGVAIVEEARAAYKKQYDEDMQPELSAWSLERMGAGKKAR